MKITITTGNVRYNARTRMTLEEEYDLIRAAQNGDQRSIDKLVEANNGLIIKYLRKCNLFGNYTYDDAYQDGVIGVIQAINKFDLNSGNRFSTYCTLWIRAIIYRAMVYCDQVIDLPAAYPQMLKAGEIEEMSSDSMDNVINDHGDSFTEYFAAEDSLDWELDITDKDMFNKIVACMEWIDPQSKVAIQMLIIEGKLLKDASAELKMRPETLRDYMRSGLEELKVPLRKLYGIVA